MNARLLDSGEIAVLIAGRRPRNPPDPAGEILICPACELFLAAEKLRKDTAVVKPSMGWDAGTPFAQMIQKGLILVMPLDNHALEIGLFSEDEEGHTTLEKTVTTAPTPEASGNAVIRKQLWEEWQWQFEAESG
jgi:hypothetical protein